MAGLLAESGAWLMRNKRRPAGRTNLSDWAKRPASPLLSVVEVLPEWHTRDECPTCSAKRDALGRLPVGLCGPFCLMARRG